MSTCSITSWLLDVIQHQYYIYLLRRCWFCLCGPAVHFDASGVTNVQDWRCCSHAWQDFFRHGKQRNLTLKPLSHGFKLKNFKLQWLSLRVQLIFCFSHCFPGPKWTYPHRKQVKPPWLHWVLKELTSVWNRQCSNLSIYWNRTWGQTERCLLHQGLQSRLVVPCSSDPRSDHRTAPRDTHAVRAVGPSPPLADTKAVPGLGCKFNLVGSWWSEEFDTPFPPL